MNKKIVVLCTSRIYDPQVHEYIEKLNGRLSEEGCALLIFTVNSDLYWDEDNLSSETAVFDIIPYNIADVIVIMDEKIKSHTISNKILDKASSYNKPVIVVDGYYEGYSHINFDYAAGFEQIVRHVFEKREIKRPHIMAGIPDNPFSDERIEVFKKVIAEHGITFDDSMLSYGQFWAIPAREETEKLIQSGNIPDAIICANDIMAINVSDVLQLHGYRVPEDVFVTGFDGYDEVFITEPRITTASCMTPELADATYELIMKKLGINITESDSQKQESDGNESDSIIVVPTLVPNESTGCEASSGYNQSMLSLFNNNFYRHQDAVRIMYETTSNMQMSKNPDQMVAYLKDLVVNDEYLFSGVSFVINRNCFNTDFYYFDKISRKITHADFCMEYDEEQGSTIIERTQDQMLLRKDSERLEKKMSKGAPLIFNALDYMDIPIGFVCYNYSDCDITKYSRTANITNTISMGIGGYINMFYQKTLADKVDEMYQKDPLTGLLNRIGFRKKFDGIRNDKEHSGKTITVIMADLDGLKYINDNYGHAEGDYAINAVATALLKACPEQSLCVRFGGDEMFSVIIGECDAEGIIKNIETLLSEIDQKSSKEYHISASCGYYTSVLEESYDIKKALRIADKNMYIVKREHQRV